MSELIIKEHKSASYAPRTYHNASVADFTMALAVDHNTAGEKCTQKAAGDKIIKLDWSLAYLSMARQLWKYMNNLDVKEPTINIAGNGIYTFYKHNVSQEVVNRIVFDMLLKVHEHWKIGKIVCGGQTGTDLAGAVAAYKLGIDCEVTLPKGFKMRFQDGKDVDTSEEFVKKLVEDSSNML